MTFVRPGSFIMGSETAESTRYGKSWPKHEVTLTKSFFIGTTDISQAQYEALRGTGANHSKHKGPDLPVEKPSWYDTQLLLKKLNRLEQGHFRLPTEAEWEYACTLSDSLRIQNMRSGLSEWCADRWQNLVNRGPQTDPSHRGGWFSLIWPFTNRVFKGETAGNEPDEIAAFRGYEQAMDNHYTIGFRIMMEIN